jgi:hypothetical protein
VSAILRAQHDAQAAHPLQENGRSFSSLQDPHWSRRKPQARTPQPSNPRSATLRGGELWVTDSAGLYRVAEGSNHTVDAPYSRGRVSALGGRLVYTGEEGTFMRGASGDSDGAWEALGSEPSRVLPTGDAEHPAVLFEGGSGGDRVRLLDARGEAVREVALPIPPRFVDAVLVHDGRLFLATSGFGLLSTELSVGEPSAEAP